KHAAGVRRRNTGAEVLHHLIGLKYIRADLVAPADIGLGGLIGLRLRLALLHLRFEQFRTQHVPGHSAVAVLRAVLLALHHDVGRDMGETDRRLGLVDVLAASTARPHDVGAHIALVDVDLDAVIHHREHHDAGERSMSARVGIERRDPHQSVHAVFVLEPAIGVVTLDRHGRRFDAGALAFAFLYPFDLVTVRFGPAHIHAHQHAGPILALGAAGTGMDF